MPRLLGAVPRSCSSLLLAIGRAHGCVMGSGCAAHRLVVKVLPAAGFLPALLLVTTTRQEVYNILWVLVFAFATLNILSLGARRFEAQKRGLNFGETLAILVVVVSIILLGWEMLYAFHILPIRLAPQ